MEKRKIGPGDIDHICRLLAVPLVDKLRQQLLDEIEALLTSSEIGLPTDISSLFSSISSEKVVQDGELFGRLVRLLCRLFCSDMRSALWTTSLATTVHATMKVLDPKVHDQQACRALLEMTFRLAEVPTLRPYLFECSYFLPRFIKSSHRSVQEIACNCVHVVCSGSLATESFVCAGGCDALGALLHSCSRWYALSALHALSKDINVAREIAHCGIIPVLQAVIDDDDPLTVSTAAGILQNIGREKSCAHVLLACEVVDSMTPLIFSPNATLQAAAIGVLLNASSESQDVRSALSSALRFALLEQMLASCRLL